MVVVDVGFVCVELLEVTFVFVIFASAITLLLFSVVILEDVELALDVVVDDVEDNVALFDGLIVEFALLLLLDVVDVEFVVFIVADIGVAIVVEVVCGTIEGIANVVNVALSPSSDEDFVWLFKFGSFGDAIENTGTGLLDSRLDRVRFVCDPDMIDFFYF